MANVKKTSPEWRRTFIDLPMKEVDGVTPVVLDVPAEGGETHSHIEPGHLHAGYVHVDVGQHRLLQDRHVVQVPA